MTGSTDWARIDKLTDDEIDAAIAQDPDTFVPDDAWWRRAVVVPPGIQRRRAVLNFDEDLLSWFRKCGRGYQHAINHALRRYVQEVERGRQDDKELAAE